MNALTLSPSMLGYPPIISIDSPCPKIRPKYDVPIAQALELNPREALWLMERNLDFPRLKGNARALDSRNYILDLRLVIRNSVF